MTTINIDDNNTELLDQELTNEDLSDLSGGLTPTRPWDESDEIYYAHLLGPSPKKEMPPTQKIHKKIRLA
ncbi:MULTISPECIES: hypothetical protein [unclassified Prochlorococcus]|uniref:hypothetical protein n=1 Tax=unclassified Prochlorococcus TaxID=2627481 RepID=UPI0039A44A29